jgi:mRNA interferase RelE/StbE
VNSIEIVFAPAAERDLKKLPKDRQREVIKTLRKLRDSSDTLEIEKIKGHPSFFRIRCGQSMRIIYHPLSANRVVVLVVCDRKGAYRNLGALDNKLSAALIRLDEDLRYHAGA